MIKTNLPDGSSIELVDYYQEFADYYPNCEMNVKRWFIENIKPDWVTIDCGANIGYHTILIARLQPYGKVIAFEPARETIEKMKANLVHNGISRVIIVEKAVGMKTGRIRDAIYRIWGKAPEERDYAFTTIDDFVNECPLKRLDCIKIDVDSFDFDVLRGAEKTLKKYDPYVVVELNHALSKRGQAAPDALKWMIEQGYRDALVLDVDNYVFKKHQEYPKDAKQLTLVFSKEYPE